jgi:hypothetical protein
MTKREINKQIRAYRKLLKDYEKPEKVYTYIESDDKEVRADIDITISWREDNAPTIHYGIPFLTWSGYKIGVNEYDMVKMIRESPSIVEWEKEQKKRVKDIIKEINKFCKKCNVDLKEIYC